MSSPSIVERRNALLARLPATTVGRLRPSLEPVELPIRTVLVAADEPIEHVYFLAYGMASVVATLGNGMQIEVGVIGREGAVGVCALMGDSLPRDEVWMQIPGCGVRLPVEVLRQEVRQSPAALDVLLSFIQTYVSQTRQNAACNAHHRIDERLARWLLMARDRTDSDLLPLTQEFLAMMLGVRRAGVTEAMGMLQQAGIIENHRGHVVVLDRHGLKDAACECYQLLANDIDGLLSGVGSRASAPVFAAAPRARRQTRA